MQCTKPILIKAPYECRREGELVSGMYVPCGKCMSCRVARAREWTVRLFHEMDDWNDTSFITLTYDDEHLPLNGSLKKSDLQKFFKRLRKDSFAGKGSLKYYAAGEYGEQSARPHYHCILFGCGLTASHREAVSRSWNYGLVHFGSVTHDSIQYVAGYVHKKLTGPEAERVYGSRLESPFQLQSQGLGKGFIERFGDKVIKDLDITIHGKHVGIPRYYKKKLGLSHVQLAQKAVDRENEVIAYYSDKGITDEHELRHAIQAARFQSDLNVKGRLSLKEGKI